MSGESPKPWLAFSAFTTARSTHNRWRRSSKSAATASRPVRGIGISNVHRTTQERARYGPRPSPQRAEVPYFRRMCSRMDKPKAVTAAAHKLARLIYTMLTKGE